MSMHGVLRLYFGGWNLPTPQFIVDAAVRALHEGHTFYSENAGLPSLRREIACQYRRLRGVELDPEREIVVTASGVQALHLAIRAALDPGDEAIVLSPAWPNGASIIALSHGVRIEANTLGWVAAVSEQQRLLEFCRDRDLWLLADEVYERIYYDGSEIGEPAPSILRLSDRSDAVHVVQSFSKSYCMTGRRVGWLVTRADLGSKLAQLNEFFVSHAATFAQVAARTALAEGEGHLRSMVESYRIIATSAWPHCVACRA